MTGASLRFEVLGATRQDEEALLQLAAHLDTVNLPNHAPSIRALLEHAERSFAAEVEPSRAKFAFLLWDHELDCVAGTSSLIAQLGTRDAPYLYFDVLDEERYSRSQDLHFRHTLLRLGSSFDGPTELGGLVVNPAYRGHAARLGRFVSFARFAYIAQRRNGFQSQLLAELMPPLLPDGRSHLWEALGRRFTHMTYSQADLLSSQDKEFITDLFPRGLVNTSLLSEQARLVVGKVGAATVGVERMLRGIGFQYARRVDPFDGGPHFVAATDRVPPVRLARACVFAGELASQAGDPAMSVHEGLVMLALPHAPYLRCVQASFSWPAEHLGTISTPCPLYVDKSLREAWGLEYNQPLTATPYSSAISYPPAR